MLSSLSSRRSQYCILYSTIRCSSCSDYHIILSPVEAAVADDDDEAAGGNARELLLV